MNFEILRWDVVLVKNHRLPIVYFKPDLALVEFLRKTDYQAKVVISDTLSVYDGHVMNASINLSGCIPCQRPNLYAETGWWVATLQSSWNNYPPFLGTLKFLV